MCGVWREENTSSSNKRDILWAFDTVIWFIRYRLYWILNWSNMGQSKDWGTNIFQLITMTARALHQEKIFALSRIKEHVCTFCTGLQSDLIWEDLTWAVGGLKARLDVRGSVSMRQYFRTDSWTVWTHLELKENCVRNSLYKRSRI